MEKGEPTFVPEWLKRNGSVSGSGNAAYQSASSSSHSDEQAGPKSARNRSLVNSSDDLSRSSVSDRTTSSYFRRNSSSNGSPHLRSYSSFGRSQRDRDKDRDRERDWDKDTYRDKEKLVLGDRRHRDYSDPLGNILPTRFEKNGLRRSHSSVSGKRGESWSGRGDSSNTVISNHNNGNGQLSIGSPVSSVHKAAFERDFPSLGAEERKLVSEIKRIPSPGVSTAIQSLPIGNLASIGGDAPKSALAEVPVIVGSNGVSASVIQPSVRAGSVSVPSSLTTGRNMAETLAQGPPRAQTAPQPSVGTQRLEELAVKQSLQLIPMTPSAPKTLTSSTSEKTKPKASQLQHPGTQLASNHNHSPRVGPVKADVSKTSSVRNFQVLKLARDTNGVSPTAKDNLSPTSCSKLPNSPLAIPSVVGPAPLRNPSNIPVLSSERKPTVAALEKKPSPQAQSRHDFFNLVRKKSMTNSSAAVPASGPNVSTCVVDKTDETDAPLSPQVRYDPLPENSSRDHQLESSEGKADLCCNGDACDRSGKSVDNGKNHSSSAAMSYPDEEEVAFLRSLGWDENAGDDEELTEEEINAFVSKYPSVKPSTRIFEAALINSQIGSNGGISSVSKLES